MRKNVKRLSLALIALGLSAPVFADSCCPSFCVTVPNQQGGFTVGADVYGLHPTASNNTFVATLGAITFVPPTLTIPVNFHEIDTKYHWAFDITAGYRFPCSGNDVTATWLHYGESSDSTNVLTHPFGISALNFDADGTAKFSLDSVDLDIGQRVNFGDHFNFRMFAGVRWADLEQKKEAVYTLSAPTVTPVSIVDVLDQRSEFKGVGPQVGFDGRYCVGYGFGIDTTIVGSLLVGHTDRSADNIFSVVAPLGPIFSVATPLTGDSDSQGRVVPALDVSLGVDYTYNFNNCARSSLVVQAGYKVVNYWNASSLIISNGVNGSTDIGFHGPYLGLKVNV